MSWLVISELSKVKFNGIEISFFVGVRFIEPAMKTGRINPTPTLKAILYTKKVLNFELTTND